MKSLFLILFAFVSFIQATGQSTRNISADSSALLKEARAAIDKGNEEWIAGWKEQDAGKVAAVFAEDGIQLSQSGKVIKGRYDIMLRQKAAMEGVNPGVKVTITTLNIWLNGETAYETGKYIYEYVEKGVPGKDEGKYVTIWKRQKNGDWKLAMDMGIPN